MTAKGKANSSSANVSLNRAPLYIQCAEHIRAHVSSKLKPGHRLLSEPELAAQFSVSVFTIREAVRRLVEEGIVERKHGSGTYVAQPKTQQHVALLAEANMHDARFSYFFLRVIQQLRQQFDLEGYRHQLYIGIRDAHEPARDAAYREFLEDVAKRKVCGVVAVRAAPNPNWTTPLATQNIPVIGPASEFPYGADMDYLGMVTAAVRHLLGHGRRRIALMCWADPGQSGDPILNCIAHFKALLAEHGVEVFEPWIRTDIDPTIHGAGWEGFREAWMAAKDKPDGLVVLDDILFHDIVRAILELDIRVPDDLMIVSYANKGSNLRFPFPVAQTECDPAEYAQLLGTMLVKLMRKQPVAEAKVCLPFCWLDAVAVPTRKEESVIPSGVQSGVKSVFANP